MADYTNSSRFSSSGVGSVLIPERWVPALETDLPNLTFWNQFMGQTWGDVEIMGEGMGKIFKVSYISDTDPATTALSEGTAIATTSSTALTQGSGTIQEYGYAERIENFADWASNVSMQEAAAVSIARNAMRTLNALIGSTFLAGGNYFTLEGTLASNINETSGTTADGTSTLLPTHITAIVSNLRRKGIAPFDDGFYRLICAPGMVDSSKAQSQVYTQASNLNMESIFTNGDIFKFNGVIFIEEAGANRVTEYGTNAKSVIFGKNAVVGWDNFMRPDTVRFYQDDQNDFGRTGKIGWYGLFGATRPVDASTNARSWVIYSSY